MNNQPRYLHVGGLVAVGFDRTGSYMLTVSHAGRGVFSTQTWERVARNYDLAYPEAGQAIGIGPIEGESISVAELDSDHPISVTTPDGKLTLECTSSSIGLIVNHPLH